MELHTGITGLDEVEVTQANTAESVGSGTLPVFATPAMLASMEKAAYTSVQPYLDEGCGTVGILLNAEHLAASPIGMHVRTESELTEIDGRVLTFSVRSYAGGELIGKGTHKRCIINSERFLSKARSKLDNEK